MAKHHFLIMTLTASAVVGFSACSSDTQEEVTSHQTPTSQPLHSTLHDPVHTPLQTPTIQGSLSTTNIATDESLADRVNQPLEKSAVLSESHGFTKRAIRIAPEYKPEIYYRPESRERYAELDNNSVVVTLNEPTSTFSIDVDTGAYANVRRFLNAGSLPPENAVRIEEMINYFKYDYPKPETLDTPFTITTELAETPWNPNTHLLHVGLNGYGIDAVERPSANLVFLIDVSGSMSAAGKLGLVKPAMQMLVNQLNENDTVSIVVYAGSSGIALEPTAGDQKSMINRAIRSLQAGGSTNGQAGIELAYALAEKNMKADTANRVILVTDGDFNVGVSNTDQLKKLIENKRKSGIALTTLGFGQGNYNDHLMEQLADIGNGAYAYIDTLNEARKVLVDELSGTLLTIAKDVKIQLEFNPSVVSEYRLIGYENRALANEDFANDKIDAGEIGADHTVTALYEIALVGSEGARNTPLRYQSVALDKRNLEEVAELRIRYKKPDEHVSQLLARQIKTSDILTSSTEASTNFNFSAAVAAFGQYLRGGKYLNDTTLDNILTFAATNSEEDVFGYRQEFMNLVRLAKSLSDLTVNSIGMPLPADNRG